MESKGFTTWTGGKQPKGTFDKVVTIVLRDGTENVGGANFFEWTHGWHGADSADIVGYQIVNKVEPAPEMTTYTVVGGEGNTPPATTAPALLDVAAGHMRDRAATYDKPEGERSMGQTVAAFNTITGRNLSESEGWLLMSLLKMVRDRARATPHRDSLEDGIAYMALLAEARLKEGAL